MDYVYFPLIFSGPGKGVVGKPNKQWGSSEHVTVQAFVETPRKAVGGYPRKKKNSQ